MEEVIIDETIKLIDETFKYKLLNFIVTKPEIALLGAWVVILPIALIIKLKLDKMSTGYNNYPTIEKYQIQFKKYKHIQNERVKPNRTSF